MSDPVHPHPHPHRSPHPHPGPPAREATECETHEGPVCDYCGDSVEEGSGCEGCGRLEPVFFDE